jgi:segregation and condensation protein A
MVDYRVRTDIYNGPMDLLLYLIRRSEIDLYDIPIATITEQYCAHVELLKVIDPNVAGDFLVLAASLMEMKSRMLLPRTVDETGEEEDLSDPRLELVRQLLEYKRFKDASFELGAAVKSQSAKWPRVPATMDDKDPAEVDLDDVQIWDLVGAFNKLMAAIGSGKVTHDVVFDDTPIALHATDILDRLQTESEDMAFEEIFAGRSKVEMIGLFLALLELMRQRRVRIRQADVRSPIKITLLSAEPIEVGEGWEPALREAVLGTGGEETEAGATEAPAEQQEQPEESPEPDGGIEDDIEEDAEGFDELDQIKTDVDIDAVLKRASAPDLQAEQPQEPENGIP